MLLHILIGDACGAGFEFAPRDRIARLRLRQVAHAQAGRRCALPV